MRTQPEQVHSSTSGLPCRPIDVYYLYAIGSGSSVTSGEIWQALLRPRAVSWQDNKSEERDGTRRQATWGPRPDSPIQHELELNMACRDVLSRPVRPHPRRVPNSIDCSVDAAAVHARWHWTGPHTQVGRAPPHFFPSSACARTSTASHCQFIIKCCSCKMLTR